MYKKYILYIFHRSSPETLQKNVKPLYIFRQQYQQTRDPWATPLTWMYSYDPIFSQNTVNVAYKKN